jgi:hypothetical protein
MKTYLGVILVALAVGGGLAFSQGQDPKNDSKDDAQKKIEVLEGDLVATRQKCETLIADLAETKATLARVVRYLDAQAVSAGALASTLDASEQAGFTYGINPSSREILLRGWREHLSTVQRDVPTLPLAPAPPSAGKKPVAKSGGSDTPTPK